MVRPEGEMWVRGSSVVSICSDAALFSHWPMNPSQASPWVGPSAGGIGRLNL